MTLPADSSSVRSLSIYESRTLILISGLSVESNGYFLLRITRAPVSAGQKHVLADAKQYSKEEVNSIVTETKCVSIIDDACCIFGLIKLVESIYITVITKAVCVANIHGHDIYTVRETNLVPITYKARNTMDESRYKSILQNLNLAYNDFYFSYTYDLFKSIQHNCLAKSKLSSVYNESLETRFIWNYYAIQQFVNCNIEDKRVTVSMNDKEGKTVPPFLSPIQRWLVPLIHGFLKQKTIRLAAECSFKYTLISRRSRMFAGTRYLRRGVDPDGFSANEVETEQIVTRLGSGIGSGSSSGSGEINSYRSSSLVQIRGSVPLYWYQTNLFVPSPDIKIDDVDHGYNAGLHHFNLLKESYGEHLTVLNLVRSQNSTREVILGAAFEEFILNLNAYYKGLECKRPNDQIDEGDIDVIKDQHKGKNGDTDKPKNEDKHGDTGRDNDKDDIMSTWSTSVDYIAFDFHGAPHTTLFSQLNDICEKIFPSSGFYLQSVSEAGDFNNGCSSTDTPSHASSSSSSTSWTAVSELEGFLSLKSITTPSRDDSHPLPLPQSLPLPPSHVVERSDVLVSNGHTQESSEFDESYKKEKEERNEIGSGIRSGFLQRGVLRTNCVDCLDRTNVAQFCYARLSLMHQLKALGAHMHPSHMQRIDALCSDIWSEHGDAIAYQYGGSGAMHSVSATTSTSSSTSYTPSSSDAPTSVTPTTSSWDLLTVLGLGPTLPPTPVPAPTTIPGSTPGPAGPGHGSLEGESEGEFMLSGRAKNALVAVQRYYSNVSADFDRQQSIDLLLGVHVPQRGCTAIWDMDMYSPTTSRGKKRSDLLEHTSVAPPTTVTVDAEAGNGSCDTLGKEVEGSDVTPDGHPFSYKSFSPGQTDHSHLIQRVYFPFRDFNHAPRKCVTAPSGGAEVLSHEVIALSDMSSRAYPPGSGVAPVVPANQSPNPFKVQQLSGKTGLNHDGNEANGSTCCSALSDEMKNGTKSVYSVTTTVPFGHSQLTDEDTSHVSVDGDGDGGRGGRNLPQGFIHTEDPILPLSTAEDAYGAGTVFLESTDPESAPSTTSYFSWLF